MTNKKFVMNRSTLKKLGDNPYIDGKKLKSEFIRTFLNRTNNSKALLYVLEFGEKNI